MKVYGLHYYYLYSRSISVNTATFFFIPSSYTKKPIFKNLSALFL